MREVFGTRPWRAASDTPAIISISNFKGGVAKTTIALHAAQHFAIRGYRVLLIDCDSQASTTMMFGYRPDVDLSEDDTLYGHFHNPELDRKSNKSELQSLMRISYAVICLKKKQKNTTKHSTRNNN